jgi:hypothetical protein
LDEYDLMDPAVLASAFARLGSSSFARMRLASTPTYAETGINEWFMRSNQLYYYLPCPRCGEKQRLTWEDNLDLECAKLVCRKRSCRADLDVWARGEWVAEAPGNHDIRGYHLSRLYSPWANLPDVIRSAELQTFSSEQQFRNQVLGEVYNPEGGRLTIEDLNRNRQDYDLSSYGGQACVMGVDVGRRMHVIIREHLTGREKLGRLWFGATVTSFDELDGLIQRFNVRHCVVDHEPEYHAARAFAQRWPRIVSLANYDRHQPGHSLTRRSSNRDVNVLSINRNEAFDELTTRVRTRLMPLHSNARSLEEPIRDGSGEYYREMMAPYRLASRGSDGRWTARWTDNGKPDHFAHAEIYSMCAATNPLSTPGRVINYGTW